MDGETYDLDSSFFVVDEDYEEDEDEDDDD